MPRPLVGNREGAGGQNHPVMRWRERERGREGGGGGGGETVMVCLECISSGIHAN